MKIHNVTNLSVVIPTYQREQVLLDTIRHLLGLNPVPAEIIVIDQTEEHEKETAQGLKELDESKQIRLIHVTCPSIPHAMNVGLKEASHDIVLFLDDDIIPSKNLIAAHARAQTGEDFDIVAGQVLQPGEKPLPAEGADFRFCSDRRQLIQELMAGNFSIKRKLAMELGGFDENFVHVAYRFETEFAERALASGEKILFEPAASIRHLKVAKGGTRSYGNHLKTIKPSHAVGEYYYLMRSRRVRGRLTKILSRPFRAVKTKHHLHHPWWIPLTLISEFLGFIWALFLFIRGPRYINSITLHKT